MAGLLGAALAGGAKGYADQQIENIKQQETFDMKKELLDAEYDMRMRLEESGIKMKEDAEQREREKVGGLLATAKDPNADKGGYETDEMKVASKRAELERGVDVLRKNGRLEDAKSLTADLTAMDKTELNLAKQEATLKRIENDYKYKGDMLDLKGKQVELQGQANTARVDAANARLEASKDKKTEKERMYDKYVERIKRQGAPDGKGGTSFTPFEIDEWDERRSKRMKLKDDDDDSFSVTTERDPDTDEVISIKETKKGKAAKKPTAAAPAATPVVKADPFRLR